MTSEFMKGLEVGMSINSSILGGVLLHTPPKKLRSELGWTAERFSKRL
jgi:hypothetical protein